MKNMVNKILFTAILALSQFSFAIPIEEKITEYLRTQMKPLSTSVSYYHYFNFSWQHQDLDTPEGRQKIAKEEASRYMNYSWSATMKSSSAMAGGAGFYAAVDPIYTSSYGNTLLEMKIKSNDLNYLPLGIYNYYSSNIDFFADATGDSELISWARRTLRPNSYTALTVTLTNLYGPVDLQIKIRKAVLDSLKKLKIVAFEYPYTTYSSYYCKQYNQIAFVFMGGFKNLTDSEVNTDDYQFHLYRENQLANLNEYETERQQILSDRIYLARIPLKKPGYLPSLTETYPELKIIPEKLKELQESTHNCKF